MPLSSQTLPFLEKAMFMENDSKYIIYPKESIYLGFYSNFDYTIDNSKEVRKLQFLPFSASFKCDGDDQIMTRTGYKQVLVGLTKTQIFFRKTALNPKIYYSDDLIGMSDNSTTKDFDTIINFVHTVNTTPKVDNKREPVKDRRNTEYCDEMNRSPNPLSLEVK